MVDAVGTPSWGRRTWSLVWAGVFTLTFATYAWRAHQLPSPIFDEGWYISMARAYANGIWMSASRDVPLNHEHPPLVKLITLWSLGRFTDPLYAVRVVAAAAAALTLTGVSVLTRRLLGGTWPALLAPAILFLDPVWDIQARTLNNDVFAAAGMVWAFVAAFSDRRWGPYAAGLAAGCAVASKYAAFMLFPVLAAVLWVRLRDGRPNDDAEEGPARRSVEVAAPLLAGLFLLPGAVLLAVHYPLWRHLTQDMGGGEALGQIVFFILDGILFASDAVAVHAEGGPAWAWLLLTKPMLMYGHEGTPHDGVITLVYGIGAPVFWWAALAGAAVLLGPAVRRRLRGATTKEDDRRFRTLGTPILMFLAGLLPFLLLSRTTFLYYIILITPYLAVVFGGVYGGLLEGRWGSDLSRRARRGIVVGLGVAAVAWVAWFWPLMNAIPVTMEHAETLRAMIPWADWSVPQDVPGASKPFLNPGG